MHHPIPNGSARRGALGFTLIELMIVVVVIGILAALAIPKYQQLSRQSREAEALPLLKEIYTLQERHRVRTEAYTLDIEQLEDVADLSTVSRYYDFSIVSHASGYCAVARPKSSASDLRAKSIDATGSLYDSASCS